MLLLFTTLEIILQCFPKEGPVLLQPLLQRLLVLVLSDKESGLTVSSKSYVTQGPGFAPPKPCCNYCTVHAAITGAECCIGYPAHVPAWSAVCSKPADCECTL